MTFQARDILELEEGSFALEANIFEPFFKANPERRPESNFITSSLWRKYIAYLKLKNNELYVDKMRIPVWPTHNTSLKRSRFVTIADLSNIFFNESEKKLPFFNGLVVLYYYESEKNWQAQWNYLPLEFFTIEKPYKFKILRFEKGKLIESKTCDTEEIIAFKNRQFEEFKKSREYMDMLNKKLEWYNKEENSKHVFDKKIFDIRIYNFILKYTKDFL